MDKLITQAKIPYDVYRSLKEFSHNDNHLAYTDKIDFLFECYENYDLGNLSEGFYKNFIYTLYKMEDIDKVKTIALKLFNKNPSQYLKFAISLYLNFTSKHPSFLPVSLHILNSFDYAQYIERTDINQLDLSLLIVVIETLKEIGEPYDELINSKIYEKYAQYIRETNNPNIVRDFLNYSYHTFIKQLGFLYFLEYEDVVVEFIDGDKYSVCEHFTLRKEDNIRKVIAHNPFAFIKHLDLLTVNEVYDIIVENLETFNLRSPFFNRIYNLYSKFSTDYDLSYNTAYKFFIAEVEILTENYKLKHIRIPDEIMKRYHEKLITGFHSTDVEAQFDTFIYLYWYDGIRFVTDDEIIKKYLSYFTNNEYEYYICEIFLPEHTLSYDFIKENISVNIETNLTNREILDQIEYEKGIKIETVKRFVHKFTMEDVNEIKEEKNI